MTQWITNLFEQFQYWGLFAIMILENFFPPIPSEAVLPAAGIAARQGSINLFLAIVVATAGSLVGVTPWYYLGRWIGEDRLARWADRYGKWLGIRSRDIRKADAWFDSYGSWAVFFGRLIPGIRTLISVPAGVSGMSVTRFLFVSTAGTGLWSAVLIGVGYWLGKKSQWVEQAVRVAGLIVVALIVFWIVKRVFWNRREERSPSKN